MYNIVVIGVGALGKRHLQSIMNSKYDMKIYCIDPYEHALDGFLDENHSENKEVSFSTNIDIVPEEVDFALFSMSSNGRREMFEQLIGRATVKYVVFEKVLFQKVEDYYVVEKKLQEHNIKAWVNCPSRIQDCWIDLKKEMDAAETFEYHVAGGRWGMACNTVHMLDAIAYLAGCDDMILLDLNLKNEIIESKRKGYKEFFGAVSGKCGKCSNFSISCYDTNLPRVIDITTPNYRYRINEAKGECTKTSIDGQVIETNFKVKLQSQLTETYLESLFETGTLALVSYEESMKIHLSLIEPLTDFFTKNGMEERLCPIT